MTNDFKERRNNPTITKNDLIEILDNVMDRHILSDSHKFVETLMKKEQRKQELYESLKKHIIGWGSICAIAFIATSMWNEFLSALKDFFIGVKH